MTTIEIVKADGSISLEEIKRFSDIFKILGDDDIYCHPHPTENNAILIHKDLELDLPQNIIFPTLKGIVIILPLSFGFLTY
jgi:hypothetical protein